MHCGICEVVLFAVADLGGSCQHDNVQSDQWRQIIRCDDLSVTVYHMLKTACLTDNCKFVQVIRYPFPRIQLWLILLYTPRPKQGGLRFVEDISWWRHQMETFSALLAICARNSPVTGEFPAQKPVTWSFDVFFLFFFICAWINAWVNNREAGDLRTIAPIVTPV